MLTPMDIHNKEFKRGFRGYSEEDVDAFMNNIAGDYEKVYREYCELKERCDSLQDFESEIFHIGKHTEWRLKTSLRFIHTFPSRQYRKNRVNLQILM